MKSVHNRKSISASAGVLNINLKGKKEKLYNLELMWPYMIIAQHSSSYCSCFFDASVLELITVTVQLYSSTL